MALSSRGLCSRVDPGPTTRKLAADCIDRFFKKALSRRASSILALPRPMFLLRKLTTKPVWWWERSRPYPIRRQWRDLPPVEAGPGPTTLAVLTTPQTFSDALWCGWSWLRFLREEVRLEIYVDGEVGNAERAAMARLLPGSMVADVRTLLSAGEFPPTVHQFIRNHPLGRKLGLLLLLQQSRKTLFCDADILCFSPPREIVELLASPQTGGYLQEELRGNYDKVVVQLAAKINRTPLPSLNAGLLLFPQYSLSLEIAGTLLQGWSERPVSWFTEQTVMACLLQSVEMRPLPRERYVLSLARLFYWMKDVDYGMIAARHFTGPTRHVMYRNALPWLRRNATVARDQYSAV
jgi:hypothetical protein